jgi:methyl-accepting chemotaxis protein
MAFAISSQKDVNVEAGRDVASCLELLDFLNAADPKGARARAIWKQIEPCMPTILDRFYTHVQNQPVLKTVLEGSQHSVSDLKKAQTSHWRAMLCNPVDEGFEARARKVGEAHVRIGLSSDWFIAGYGLVLMEAIPVVL